MIYNNIQTAAEVEAESIVVPKLPHCAQSPDLDGVLEVVVMRSKKTFVEIRDMITFGKVTLTCKVIKENCYRSSITNTYRSILFWIILYILYRPI